MAIRFKHSLSANDSIREEARILKGRPFNEQRRKRKLRIIMAIIAIWYLGLGAMIIASKYF